MSNHFSLTPERHKAILRRSQDDIRLGMYAKAAAMGLDVDNMDYLDPSLLWQTEEKGVSKIDEWSDAEKRPYVDLLMLSQNLKKIIEKLEGPNRIF